MGANSNKEKIYTFIKEDNDKDLKSAIPLLKPNKYINENKTFTLLDISTSYGSLKCSELLINSGWDVNCPELIEGNSPLLLCCKFGHRKLAEHLLKKFNADIKYINYKNLNCLDVAIIYSNLGVASTLITNFGMALKKSADEYKNIIKEAKLFIFDFDNLYNELSKLESGDPNYEKEVNNNTNGEDDFDKDDLLNINQINNEYIHEKIFIYKKNQK